MEPLETGHNLELETCGRAMWLGQETVRRPATASRAAQRRERRNWPWSFDDEYDATKSQGVTLALQQNWPNIGRLAWPLRCTVPPASTAVTVIGTAYVNGMTLKNVPVKRT